MKERLRTVILLLLISFTGSSASYAQTHTITHQVDWVTSNQNMWGPNGSPFTINMDIDLFDIYFDTLVSVNAITSMLGGQFGVALDIDTWLEAGSTFSLHGFTTGSVDAEYPVNIDVTFPNNNTFNPGQNVTIETDYTVQPGWDLTTHFPSAGVAQLDLFFGMGLDIDATVCLWNCWTFTPISVQVPTDSINIFYLDSQNGAFSYPCWTGSSVAICHDTILPIVFSVPAIGLTGSVDIPYVTTTDHLGQDNCIYANGDDLWLQLDIDVIQFLSAIAGLIPPPTGPAIQQFLSMLSGTINIGAGITIDYVLLDMHFGMGSYMQQDFTLCPTVWTTFSFPASVNYTVTCPDSNNMQVDAGNASTITLMTGHDLHFDYPCYGYPVWDIGMQHFLTNDFTNHTWDSMAFYFSLTAFEFWINIPSFPVMPDLCIPPSCLDVLTPCPDKAGVPDSCWQQICTPEICVPAINANPADPVIHIGPLFQQTWPVGYIPITWYNNTWQLAGWTPSQSGFYDTIMPNHQIVPNPPISMYASVTTPIICYGDSSGGITAYVQNGTAPYTYSWSPGGSTTSSQTSNTLSNVSAGTYYITVTDVNGCMAADTVQIASSNPPLYLSLLPVQVTCIGGSDGSITADVSGGTPPYIYSWAPYGGNNSVASGLGAGTYWVTVTDAAGCPISDTTTLYELYPLPDINFTADRKNGCQPLTVQFYETTPSQGQTYLWDFHDGTLHATDKNPLHTFVSYGSYDITLYVTSAHGCLDSLTQDSMITVYPKPVADFLPRPAETDILDATVSFDNLSSNTFFCYWTFGDGNTSYDTEPVHQYSDTGSHQVYLYIQTEYGCRDTATEMIHIREAITFYAPNAFTPDHNGSNEIFLVKGSGIDNSTFSMMIYDRWGQLVFESEDLYKGWDGSIRGREADETAVYAWIVRFRDITGRHHIYRGSVILIR